MSYANLSQNSTQVTASIVNPAGGTTTLDSNNRPVFTPATPIVVKGNLTDLSVSDRVARSQIQDNSTHKLVIADNTVNRTIESTFKVTIDSILYRIHGEPKHPVLPIGWLTIYLLKK